MANYYGTTRTNYFRVKDEQKFRDVMSTVACTEDQAEIWEEKDKDGNKTFGFGCYSSIIGFTEGDDINYDLEELYVRLSDCVADDDAIIIQEVGNEKLRYVVGSAVVITTTDIEYVDLTDEAVRLARTMLKNSTWTTNCDY